MSRPWISVEEDGEGTALVNVEENHLSDFPKFMKCIIDEEIGLEKGVFKINIVDRQGGTTLSEILNAVHKYYSTLRSQTRVMKGGSVRNVHAYPELKVQTFKKVKNDHLYGYLDALRTSDELKKDRKDFLKVVESTEMFVNDATCCLQVLSKSLNEAVDHYWEQIDIAARAPDDHPITYGAGIPMEEMDIKFSTNFSLSKLKTILDLCPISYPGIQYPYLYVGSKHATFPWHIEDSALFSTNALYYGAPCVWFFIPPQYYKKFVDQIQFYPLELTHTSCVNVIGHKYVVASKDFLQNCGIPVHTVVQREGDIVVVYPFAAHSGFKCGRNIQIASNFADPWWVEPAILSPKCACFLSAINLDLTEFIAVSRPHLLNDYISKNFSELYKELQKNEFIRKLGLLPSSSSDKESTTQTLEPSVPILLAKEDVPPENAFDNEPQFCGARATIKCPGKDSKGEDCKKSFEGGRQRLPRMRKHIDTDHNGDQQLKDKLDKMYPPKKNKSSRKSFCSICNQFISGNKFHLDRHIERTH